MTALLDAMRQLVGPAHVSDDDATRALMSEDIWAQGAKAAMVVAPASTEEVARVVAAATAAGVAVLPRGAGMSYTNGYVSDQPGGLVLDLQRMDKVVAVDAENMIVTVEAGASWKTLNEALASRGLRTPFWGPLSGITSTIGGGLSQHNAFFGAGHYGTGAESVTSLTVVLADGSIVKTGAEPFYRFYGPDLGGLFLGDAGALGVKTEATLRLIHAPEHEGWASFEFATKEGCMAALSDIARRGLASELVGFDPQLARVRMQRASLLADAGTLAKVVGAQKSLFAGLKEGARMALAGRSFMDNAAYSLHAVAEGRSKAGVESDVAAIRAIAAQHGGREIENTIPKVIRANPFTPLNNVLGPGGERWAPVHGIIRHTDAPKAWAAIDKLFADNAEALERHEITTGYLVTSLSTNAALIEPVFFWPDARFALHEETVEAGYLAKLPKIAANPAATETVARLRKEIVDIFTGFGAAHFQIGRSYPFAETRDAGTRAMLEAIKQALDPARRMNPGALGL